MRAWLVELARGRSLELATALALGIALAALAKATADLGFDVVGQLIGRNPFDEEGEPAGATPGSRYLLNFEIGSRVVFYGDILAALFALGLVALVALAIVRRRDRSLGECPLCASRIPYESTHCAYCGSAVAPGKP